MIFFLKYIPFFALILLLTGCNGDAPPEAPPQSPIDGQTAQPQPPIDTDVTDQELDQFLSAFERIQEVQMEAQQEMIAIVENEGLTVETYNQIAEGIQTGRSPEEIDASEDEIDRYESASESIEEVEEQIENRMAGAVEGAGMDMDRFRDINMAIQQDPELQQRVQEKMQEHFMQPQPQEPQPDGF